MMRRAAIILALAILSLARPAFAQSDAGSLAETLQKEGQAQINAAKKYTGKSARSHAYMSAPRPSLNYGSADATGRFDMSGQAPPGYFRLRDQSTNFSTRNYNSVLGRRAAPRSTYTRKSAGAKTTSGIPPAPR